MSSQIIRYKTWNVCSFLLAQEPPIMKKCFSSLVHRLTIKNGQHLGILKVMLEFRTLDIIISFLLSKFKLILYCILQFLKVIIKACLVNENLQKNICQSFFCVLKHRRVSSHMASFSRSRGVVFELWGLPMITEKDSMERKKDTHIYISQGLQFNVQYITILMNDEIDDDHIIICTL